MAIIRSRYFFAPLIAAAALTLPACAYAQPGPWRGPAAIERGRYADSGRVAYDHGYTEGLKEGERDARRGDRFAYQDEREFRDGDRGYHRSHGDRDRYRRSFRSGYAAGYSDAYRRTANYGRNGRYESNRGYGYGGYGRSGYGYYSPGFDNGVRDGFEKGQEDARRNRSFDPLRHSWYRSGDRHYEREYGSRDAYKDVYRRGFQEGYERGYRQLGYRW